MDSLLTALDEDTKMCPNLKLCQDVYKYEISLKTGDDAAKSDSLKTTILEQIFEDNMAPYYDQLCAKFAWTVDEEKMRTMRETNDKDLENIEKTRLEAIENAGDTEVMDAMFARARNHASTGNCAEAFIAYDAILNKEKTSTSKKIDATLEQARVAFFFMDMAKLKVLLPKAKELNELGGDWDRRNRLKVYEAIYLILCRELRQASVILLECVATFSCVEMMSYEDFMFQAIICSIISLPRSELRTQVVKNSQVISVIREHPKLQRLLLSIYNCEYEDFFKAIVELYPTIVEDRYIGSHVTYLVREYRVTAYSQFLDAYKSVMLSSMAKSFGISIELLDTELSRFIAVGRLNAKIDKVGDIIETTRPDKKNGQYQETIKKGDALLNQIQKLARVVQM
jgi:26S proteasome regulatory subunit N7